jgi:hypothetical protein
MRTARLLQVLCAAHMQCVVGDVIWTEWASLEGWPPPRAKSAVALLERVGYLDSDPKIMMFGGSDTAGVRSDLWMASLNFLPLPSIEIEADPDTAGSVPYNPTDAPVWEEIQATGAWPAARSDHSLTALADGRVLLFGGAGDEGDLADAMNDLWVYDVRDRWSLVSRPLNASTATCDTDGRLWPMKRFGHKSMALGTTMWMFGGWISGCGQSSVNGELWSYNSDEAVVVNGDVMNAGWQRHRPLSLRPSARVGHSMLDFDGMVGLLGGWDGTLSMSDMWSYDPSTSLWTQMRTDNTPDEPPPAARYGAAVEPVAGGIILYGGSDRGASSGTDSVFDDVWVFTFDAEPETTTRSISESMGDGSGTKTTTTTIRTVATNRNLWMEQQLGNVPAPMRSYHGSLVWGNPGYEHILIIGGTDPDGRPTCALATLVAGRPPAFQHACIFLVLSPTQTRQTNDRQHHAALLYLLCADLPCLNVLRRL